MEILNWIKKYRIRAIIISIVSLALILIPFFIYQPSEDGRNADLLGYYGACLATLGTVFLGVVALLQNFTINKQARDYQEAIRNDDLDALSTHLKCREIRYFYGFSNYSKNSSKNYLLVYLENTTNIPASDIALVNISFVSTESTKLIELVPSPNNSSNLNAFGVIALCLWGDIASSPEGKLSFSLNYNDGYATHVALIEATHLKTMNKNFEIELNS